MDILSLLWFYTFNTVQMAGVVKGRRETEGADKQCVCSLWVSVSSCSPGVLGTAEKGELAGCQPGVSGFSSLWPPKAVFYGHSDL